MFSKIEILNDPALINESRVNLGVHATETTEKSRQTALFKGGTIRFNTLEQTVQIKDLDPLPLPKGLRLRDGLVVSLHLFDHEGNRRKIEPREAVLVAKSIPNADKTREPTKSETEFAIPGMAKQPEKFRSEDGWTYRVVKLRAYKSHEGVKTDEFPEWITALARRNRLAWDHMAAICRNASRACSTVSVDDVIAFRDNVFLPELNAFNDSMGRVKGKQKIECPKKLKEESPEIPELLRFTGKLRDRVAKGKPVPVGLEQKIQEFVASFKFDLTPLMEFEKNVTALLKEASVKYGLSSQETETFTEAFRSALKRRKTTKATFDKGWPAIVYEDNPRYNNWSFGIRNGKPGHDSRKMFQPGGLFGIEFGDVSAPAACGHSLIKPGSRRSKRRLRPATVTTNVLELLDKKNPEDKDEEPRYKSVKATYTFAVLDHVEIPENTHLSEWSLVYRQNASSPSLKENGIENKRTGSYEMWLCLTLKVKNPTVGVVENAAGIDIGWWREKEGIRIASVYNPVRDTHRSIHLNLEELPDLEENKRPTGKETPQGFRPARTPFTLNIGVTRWGKRSRKHGLAAQAAFGPLSSHDLGVLTEKTFEPETTFDEMVTDHLKNLRAGIEKDEIGLEPARGYFSTLVRASYAFVFLDDFAGKRAIQQRRDALKDVAKVLICKLMGTACPSWLRLAGLTKIHKEVRETENPVILAVAQEWAAVDALFGERQRFIANRLASRIEKGYELLAHDICKWLAGDVQCLRYEKNFLATVAGAKDNENHEAIKNGAKYRQLAALGVFMTKLKNTLGKYGMTSEAVPAEETTSTCHVCQTVNEVGAEREFKCVSCGTLLDQDQNAAVNIAYSKGNPEEVEPLAA